VIGVRYAFESCWNLFIVVLFLLLLLLSVTIDMFDKSMYTAGDFSAIFIKIWSVEKGKLKLFINHNMDSCSFQ